VTPPPASTISGWGGLAVPGREVFSEDLVRLTEDAVLCRGLGRAYGDSACPPASRPEVATTTLADRILSFDEETGTLRAEAGLSLFEIKRLFLPWNWFTPVTPGTQYVTLGGMVAADVHGKNHHVEGCFGAHVISMLLRVADGRLVECSPEVESELFWATVGGMGLTGHILEVEFRMRRIPSPWIDGESFRVPNIDAYIDALKESGEAWPFTMGWIDCRSTGKNLGRGILYRGRWADPGLAPAVPPRPKRRSVLPFHLPNWFLNKLVVIGFNEVMYRMHIPEKKAGIRHPDDFFYPLDKLLHWNRLYGKRGFTQYQCVLPNEAGRGAARRFLERLTELGGASSFLCVIKDCAEESRGLLSFPFPGISIALDLAANPGIQELVDRLNELVIEMGGRVYLAKDAFTRPEHFRAMEPRLDKWMEVRRKWDPELRLRSAQSVRIFGDPA
jgi:FAD/FMN-containing dehydrogenase